MEDCNSYILFQIFIILILLISEFLLLLGGFSMGGCMAMHLAYRNHQDVAGVFALSSFLNKASAVYQVSFIFKKQNRRKKMRHTHIESKMTLIIAQ